MKHLVLFVISLGLYAQAPLPTFSGSGGGGGGGGAATCGSTTTQVCYNNAGAFGGITGATSDGTNLAVTTQSANDNSTKAASTAYVDRLSLATKVNSVNLNGSGAFTCNFSLGYICLVNQNGDSTNPIHPTFSNLPTNAFVYLAMNMTNLKSIDFTDTVGATPRCNIQDSFTGCGDSTNGFTSPGGIFTTTWWSDGTHLDANGDTGNFQTISSSHIYTNQLSLQDTQNITNPPNGISMLFGAPLKFIPKCASAASPAACSSYAAGAVALPTGGSTLVVDTSAVKEPGSMIILTPDSSLGATLSVTCNTGIPSGFQVSSRVDATSFTISVGIAPVTNPFCFNYFVITN